MTLGVHREREAKKGCRPPPGAVQTDNSMKAPQLDEKSLTVYFTLLSDVKGHITQTLNHVHPGKFKD